MITGWVTFLSKLELVACMIFGAFSSITGKFKKLARFWMIFEVVLNIGSIILGLGMERTNHDSWKETFKTIKEQFLDKELVPKDDFWEKECDKLYKQNAELQNKLKAKEGRQRRKKMAEEELNKEFNI
jgi:hypothetical protein